ncbi:MAG: twin-arginine translocase TatA/TatE family subunit [Zavarzinella sp.]
MFSMKPMFAMFGLGTTEILVILVLGVLLFGRNLPGIARSLGKSVTDFKRGMSGIEDQMESAMGNNNTNTVNQQPETVRPPQRVTSQAPRFDDGAN